LTCGGRTDTGRPTSDDCTCSVEFHGDELTEAPPACSAAPTNGSAVT
jgi:hypothetical protein